MGTLPTCDHPTCTGHLGKFSSCLDEWLYECSMDGASETFGDTDWTGHYAIVEVSEEESWTGPGYEYGGTPVVPAPGVYVVFTAPSGRVAAWRYDTMQECEADLSETRAAYEAWSTVDGEN